MAAETVVIARGNRIDRTTADVYEDAIVIDGREYSYGDTYPLHQGNAANRNLDIRDITSDIGDQGQVVIHRHHPLTRAECRYAAHLLRHDWWLCLCR
jgi:hypothetical protein